MCLLLVELQRQMCAAIVSARRPASSMPDSDVRISGGIFLVQLHVLVELLDTIARRNASSFSVLLGMVGVRAASRSQTKTAFPVLRSA